MTSLVSPAIFIPQLENVIKNKLKKFRLRQNAWRYYVKNRELVCKKNNTYIKNNRERYNATARKYQQTEEYKKKRREYYKLNKDRLDAQNRACYKRRQEEKKAEKIEYNLM